MISPLRVPPLAVCRSISACLNSLPLSPQQSHAAIQVGPGLRVDLVAAEDTRLTGNLLKHFGIAAKLISVREHNEQAGALKIIEALHAGLSVALVTDAGTPAVSDPGARAVAAVRAAGLVVVPIPMCSTSAEMLERLVSKAIKVRTFWLSTVPSVA